MKHIPHPLEQMLTRHISKGRRLPILIVAGVMLVAVFWVAVAGVVPEAPSVHYDMDRIQMLEEGVYGIGPRVTGSAAEGEVADLVAYHFEEAGLSNVHIEEYPMICYDVEHVEMTVNVYGPLGVLVQDNIDITHLKDLVVQGFSGSTGGSRTYDVVWVNDGQPGSYPPDVAGKAVLATNKPISGSSRSATQLWITAQEKGAAAFILMNEVYNPDDNYEPIGYSAAVTGEDGHAIPVLDAHPGLSIPSMTVSRWVGETLRDEISTVTLDIDVTVEVRPLRVVVGDVVGRDPDSDDFVLVQAHHDTVYTTSGAIDNALGTAQAMEMAYLLSGTEPLHTIRITTVGGEEGGLLGSYAYFKAHEEDVRDDMILDMNLDSGVVTIPNGRIDMYFSSPEFMDEANSSIQWYFDSFPEENDTVTLTAVERVMLSGHDVATYEMEGLPGMSAVGIDKAFPYHRPGDVIELVDYESMGVLASVFARTAWEVSEVGDA